MTLWSDIYSITRPLIVSYILLIIVNIWRLVEVDVMFCNPCCCRELR